MTRLRHLVFSKITQCACGDHRTELECRTEEFRERLDSLLEVNKIDWKRIGAEIPSFIEELEGSEWSENEEVKREYSRAMYSRLEEETCTRLCKTYGWRWMIKAYNI